MSLFAKNSDRMISARLPIETSSMIPGASYKGKFLYFSNTLFTCAAVGRSDRSDVIFLRKLLPGGVAHSFGIHVARMAGMPREIVESAEKTLRELEQREKHAEALSDDGGLQLSFFQLDDPTLSALREKLEAADLNNMTPLQAFDLLRDMKTELGIPGR